MLTLIGKVDYTSYVPFESIQIQSVAGDPVSTASFQVKDPGSTFSLQSLQEVIFIDETVALTPSSAGNPSPFTDSFASNDISNYTSTYNPVPPGSLASWVISSGVLTASGGAYALLTVNNWRAQDVTVSATMTQSDWGGIAFNIVDTKNYYEVAVSDASSPGAGLQYAQRGLNSTLLIRGRIQLYRTVNGVRSALGSSVPIPFVRGTSHVIVVTAANNGTTTQIGVAFDGVQVIGYLDASSPLGRGSVGLRNDTVSGASSAIYDAFSATSNDLPVLTTSQPTCNYLNNNNFNFSSGGWTESGALTGRITFPSSGTYGSGAVATLSFANQAVGTDSRYQTVSNAFTTATDYAVPGQQYSFSATINVTANFVNSYAFLQLIFLDSGGNVLNTLTSSNITTGSGIFFVQGTAPAGTFQLRVAFGGTTTSTTNSGTATFTALMLEPMWFPALYSYPSPICDFLQSDSVSMPDGTTARFDRIFTGNITHLDVSYEGTTRTWDVQVTSIDGWLENVGLVNATFNGVTDQSVIGSIIAPVPLLVANTPALAAGTPQALAYRNVSVCVAGVTVPNLQFADATLREVFDALYTFSGFPFGVDAYYGPYYYPPFYNAAPYGFAGNGTAPDYVNTFPYYDYNLEIDASQIQNTINVSGTTYAFQFTESWHAQDGSHVEGLVGGKTANAVLFHNPINVPSSVVVGGSTISCALETNTGFGSSQSLCAINYPYISFLTTISAGTSISITYFYSALVYIQAQSPDSIAEFGRAYYSKINNTNLVSNAQAVVQGEAQLQSYAQPRMTVKFSTTKMLHAGQTIELSSALDGLNKAHFSVQKVTATYLGNGINQYAIEAGTYVDDFVDFFRNSQKAINRADHDPAEPIKQTNLLQQDSASYTDSLSIHP